MRVKICGLTREADVAAAAEAGAAYLGFVLFPPSPRNVTPDRLAELALAAPPGVVKVALVVDPEAARLAELERLPIDMVQLHGRESPERVAEIRARLGLPVMKALGIEGPGDLAEIAGYEAVADQLLLDAKPPRGATRPGGNARAFDWALVAGRRFARPWLLAGGLSPETVGRAVALSGARQVDVSSGVESAPGVKDPARIRAFVAAARAGAEGRPTAADAGR